MSTTDIKAIANSLLSNGEGELARRFNHKKTETLSDYIRIITGIPVNVQITIEDFKTVMVDCSINDLFEIVKSWCSYYNSRENEKYIMICKLVGAYDIKIIVEERNSIGKNICYRKNDVELYRLFLRQILPDGSYHKQIVGYIVEAKDKLGVIKTKLFDSKEKTKAKKCYKLLQGKQHDRS